MNYYETTVTIEGSYPYDNAPGGSNPTAETIAKSDTDGYGDITTEISNHCFIPTVSFLAINTSDLFYNVSADPNILSKTPFDAIYYPLSTNEKHAHISPECITWLLDELVPEHLELDGIRDSWNKGEVTASGSITLKPGFSTIPGTSFHAHISSPLSCSSSLRAAKTSDDSIDRTSEITYTNSELKNNKNVSVSVFPNPSNRKFYVHISAPYSTGSIEIRNIQGERLSQTVCNSDRTEYYMDISNHPNGIYLVITKLNAGIQTFKIIKK
jgi:hypothetical protein